MRTPMKRTPVKAVPSPRSDFTVAESVYFDANSDVHDASASPSADPNLDHPAIRFELSSDFFTADDSDDAAVEEDVMQADIGGLSDGEQVESDVDASESTPSNHPSDANASDDDEALDDMQSDAELDAASDAESDAEGESDRKALEGKPAKLLSQKKLEKFQQEHDRTGVVYMSRVPPFMKPLKVKHMLSHYGEIGRIYLAQEDSKSRTKRVKFGGNKRRNFKEGWIEFKDKRIAKMVAATLNNTTMGGKKSNYYHDDIWNLKYLPKFKWTHLTQQLAYERQERAKKLQVEIGQAKKEISLYLKNVDKAKMIQGMEDKRAKKRVATDEPTAELPSNAAPMSLQDDKSLKKIRRRFKQRKITIDADDKLSASMSAKPSSVKTLKQEKVGKVLSKIFT